MRRWYLPVAALVAAVGCDSNPAASPKGGGDDLTIVVEADRSRIAVEEATLQEQRKTLETERERLNQELSKFLPGREAAGSAEVQQLVDQAFKLVRRQQDLVDKRDELSRQRDQLLERVLSVEGGPASGQTAQAPTARSAELERLSREASAREREAAAREKETAVREKSMADREAELAAREKALASREAALAQREASCGAASARQVDRGSSLPRGEVTKAYKALLASMHAKGILAADLQPSQQKSLQQAASLHAKGDPYKAMEAIEAVQAAVDSLAVDAGFVSQKVKRVNSLPKRSLDTKTQQEVAQLLQSVTRSYSDGRYLEANRALNNLAHLLEKSSGR